MEPLFYSTGHSARELGISQVRVRDLCRNGAIEAEMTDGGQFRIPREVLEKLKREGIPPMPKPLPNGKPVATVIPAPGRRSHPVLLAAPSEEVVDSAEEVVCLENEVKSLGLRRQKEEQLDWFREREDRDAERAAQRHAAEYRRRAQEAAEERRRRWKNEWLEYGVKRVPSAAPQSLRLDGHQAVVEALDRLDPSDLKSTVRQLVDAAVDRALTPWRNAKQIGDAIKDLCEGASVPWDMRHDAEWKARMYQAAGAAVGRLRDGATLNEMQIVTGNAVAALVQEFEHGRTCEQLANNVSLRLSRETLEEREQGKNAVRAALFRLPVGTSRSEMERVREKALEPTRVNIAAREDRAMRDGMLLCVELQYKVRELPREEQQNVVNEIRGAFNQLPAGTIRSTLDKTIATVVDRYYSVHEQREREKKVAAKREVEQQQKRRDAAYKAGLYLGHIEAYLKSEYEFDGGYFEMCRERDRLREPIRQVIIERLLQDPNTRTDDIHCLIEDLVDEDLD